MYRTLATQTAVTSPVSNTLSVFFILQCFYFTGLVFQKVPLETLELKHLSASGSSQLVDKDETGVLLRRLAITVTFLFAPYRYMQCIKLGSAVFHCVTFELTAIFTLVAHVAWHLCNLVG